MPVHARYYTDPACSASWAAEPRRRSLLVEFGNDLPFTYVMGGLARDYEARSRRAHRALAGRRPASSRMPMDPRLWSENPIRSSFPACMAVKAAAEQGPEAADRYLRAVREGLMCHRRRLDTADPLAELARAAGLDVSRFRVDLDSNAIVEAFGADLEETRSDGRGAPLDPVRRPRRHGLGSRRGALRGMARRRYRGRSGALRRAAPGPARGAAPLRAAGHRRGRGGLRPLEPGGRDGAVAAGGGGACAARAGADRRAVGAGLGVRLRPRTRRPSSPRAPAPAAPRPRRRP